MSSQIIAPYVMIGLCSLLPQLFYHLSKNDGKGEMNYGIFSKIVFRAVFWPLSVVEILVVGLFMVIKSWSDK